MLHVPGHHWSRTVLLAGYEEEFRRLLEVTLPGLLVETVAELEQAAGRIAEGRYALILFDLEAAPETLAELLASRPDGVIWAATVRASASAKVPDLVAMGVERIFYHPVAPGHLARQLSWLLRLESPAAGGGDDSDLAVSRDSELFETFLTAMRERISRIFTHASVESSPEERVELTREAHRMIGSLGAFGFPLGSEMARGLEELLSAGPLTQAVVVRVTSLCQDLLDLIEGTAAQAVHHSIPPSSNLPLVSLVTGDEPLREQLSESAGKYGLRIVASPAESFPELLSSASTDAVIYDFGAMEHGVEPEVAQLLRRLVCPVIAVCPRLTLRQRVEISELGVASIVEKPFDIAPILANLHGMLALPMASRVLAIDDDGLFLRRLESLLVPLGTEFIGVTEPETLWSALEAKAPDLVLLDIDMPEIDGLALCRAIRSDHRFLETPVVFITSSLCPEVRRAAYEAGAEDYISKLTAGVELRIRIATRLRRARASRNAETDFLTGLPTRAPAVKALNHLLKLGERRSLPISLAVLDLDRFKAINDTYGHPVGDLVLQRIAELFRRAVRSEDVISRWGGEEFVAGMFLMDKELAAQRLRSLLDEVKGTPMLVDGHEFTVTFSAGVAQFPNDGRDLSELYKAADHALYLAKRTRCCVVTAASPDLPDDVLDLVLVEDDHPLGSVLMEAFAERGWKAAWFQDGAEAWQALLGTDVVPLPTVVVIDRELPGLDGIDLIEKLAAKGICNRSKIITVSAKMTTEEIDRVLELGVFDHVSKPFSLPVLLRRVEIARKA